MSLLKRQLSAALEKKYLDLYEKSVILDYENEHPNTNVLLAMYGPCLADPRFLNFNISCVY